MTELLVTMGCLWVCTLWWGLMWRREVLKAQAPVLRPLEDCMLCSGVGMIGIELEMGGKEVECHVICGCTIV